MLSQRCPTINDAKGKIIEMSANEKIRAIALGEEISRRDWHAWVNAKFDEGRAEGRAEGWAKKGTEVAINLLRRNYPLEEIAQIADIPLQEVIRLSKDIH
jgi:hypothetical protein